MRQLELFDTQENTAGVVSHLWENVPGAFSSNKGRDFAAVVEQMAGLQDVAVPKDGWGKEGAAVGNNGLLEWSVLDAQWFGLAQRRKRVFAIVDFGDWASRPPILLERESLRGDTPPSRSALKRVATATKKCLGSGSEVTGSILASCAAKQFLGNQKALGGNYHVIEHSNVVGALARDYKDATDSVVVCIGEQPPNASINTDSTCPTLTSAMGVGGGHTPIVCCGEYRSYGCTPMAIDPHKVNAITASYGQGGADLETKPLVLQSYPINTMSCQGRPSDDGRMGLGVGEDGDPCPTLTKAHSHAVVYGYNLRPQELTVNYELSQTLRASDHKKKPGVYQDSVVRRLTPMECERLQGFPDDFTKIPYRNKSVDDCPIGPRYKALGNSMAVNVMAWIGRQVQAAIDYQE